MSEKRFLELVNLYLDEEISNEEQAELDRELEVDSYRQEVFNRYCRLQEASRQVSHCYGTHLASTVDFKKYEIFARSSRRQVRKGFFYSAGALAAACLTVAASLHVIESTLDYTELPPLPVEDRFAEMPVEVFEPAQITVRRVGGSSRNTHAVWQTGGRLVPQVKETDSSPEAESVPFTRTVVSDSDQTPRVFQAKLRFESSQNTPATTPVVRSDSGFDPAFASFQFQR